MNTRILIVEDEPGIAMALEDELTNHGYAVEVAGDGFSQYKGGDASVVIAGSEGAVQSGFNGWGARWSPDGKSIAFIRMGDVIIRSVSNGEERRHTLPGLDLVSPRWLPDGSAVVVRANQSGPTGDAPWFYLARADGTSIRPLFAARTPQGILSGVTAISPDGKTLYASIRQADGGRWTGVVGVDMATGTPEPVITFPEGGLPGAGQPGLGISPDGETLAIMGWAVPETRHARLFTVRTDGTDSRSVHGPFPAWNTTLLRWSVDGKSLVFVGRDGSRPQLLRLAVAGGVPEPDPLTTFVTPDSSSFDLSPDGTRIVTNGRNPIHRELWVMDGFLTTVVGSR